MIDSKKILTAALKIDRIINGMDVCDEESQKLHDELSEVRDLIVRGLDGK